MVSKKVLPEYILFAEIGDQKSSYILLEVCRVALESLKNQGQQLYEIEKIFDSEMEWSDFRTGYPRQRKKYLFHLNT